MQNVRSHFSLSYLLRSLPQQMFLIYFAILVGEMQIFFTVCEMDLLLHRMRFSLYFS